MKKIIFGFLLFLFIGLNQTFANFYYSDKNYYLNLYDTSSSSSNIVTTNFKINQSSKIRVCDDTLYFLGKNINNQSTGFNSYNLTTGIFSTLYSGAVYSMDVDCIDNKVYLGVIGGKILSKTLGENILITDLFIQGYNYEMTGLIISPFHNKIFFGSQNDLYSANLDGTNIQNLGGNSIYYEYFTISNNGEYLIFKGFEGGQDRLYRYTISTGVFEILLNGWYLPDNNPLDNNQFVFNNWTTIETSAFYPFVDNNLFLNNINGFIFEYTNNSWPPPLSEPTHYQEDVEGGVKMNFVCDQDCMVGFAVYNENQVDLYNSVIGTFSGSTETQSILLDNVSLLYGANYYYVIVFTDLHDPGVEYFYDYTSLYWFDSTPNDYSIGDFTFTPFEFTRKDNGFSIKGLDVNIPGGVFFLNILAPNGYDTGLYFTEFVRIWTNKVEQGAIGTGYGINKTIEVLEPFHQWAGDYELIISYQYPGQGEMFPYGIDNKIYYTISAPGNNTNVINENTFSCDKDFDGLVSITEGITCIPSAINYGLSKIYMFFNNISGLIEKIGESFTSEVRSFTFLPQTHAENLITGSLNNVDQEAFDQTFFGKLVIFIKGFVVFMVFLIGILVFLALTRKRND